MKLNQQEKCDGELLSNCCAWDFNPMGFEKEPGIWQERCIRCGRLCEPLWISERDIKNIRRLTEFEKPIPLPAPPETGREWKSVIVVVQGMPKAFIYKDKSVGSFSGEGTYISLKALEEQLPALIRSIESSALAQGEKIGAEKERARLSGWLMHDDNCKGLYFDPKKTSKCDCGLADALKG